MIVHAPSLDVGGSMSRAISERTIFQVRRNDGSSDEGFVGCDLNTFRGKIGQARGR